MTNLQSNTKVLLIYLFGQFFSVIIFVIAGLSIPNITTDLELQKSVSAIVMLLMYVGITITFLVVYKTYFIDQARDFIGNTATNIILIVATFFAILTAGFLSNEIMIALGINDQAENQAALEALANGKTYMKVILIVVTLILAPIIEEFTFRKGIFGVFEKYNIVVPIILSGLVFGLIHVLGDNLIQIIPYALSGIALSIMYVVSNKNIYVVIGGHMAFNFFALLPILITM